MVVLIGPILGSVNSADYLAQCGPGIAIPNYSPYREVGEQNVFERITRHVAYRRLPGWDALHLETFLVVLCPVW